MLRWSEWVYPKTEMTQDESLIALFASAKALGLPKTALSGRPRSLVNMSLDSKHTEENFEEDVNDKSKASKQAETRGDGD